MWNSMPGVLIICLTIGWVLTTWIRAKHGYPVEDTLGGTTTRISPKESEKLLNQQLAERDAKIANLEERVRVLERIVTRRSELDEEFDRLRA
jgi:hypothetical protein